MKAFSFLLISKNMYVIFMYYSRVSNNRTASIKRTLTPFHIACKEGQFDVVELMVNDQFKTFSINLNAQHVNGITPFGLAFICLVIRYSRVPTNRY